MADENILHRSIPISEFDKGKAAQIFDRLHTEKELVVLKDDRPSAVILSPEEYTRLIEIEEDHILLLEAERRLEENGDQPAVSLQAVLAELGISKEELQNGETGEPEGTEEQRP